MSILVHSGAEGVDYNSYASLAEADAYHAARATTAWTSVTDPAVRTAALIRATDYIDATYRFSVNPVLGTGLDALIVKATIVMAVYALSDTLAGKADREIVEEEKEAAGVGKKRVKYAEGQAVDPYPMVTKILAPLTGNSGGGGVSVGKVIR
ncbi:DnaT-like ssDNA-binding protein [Brevundimonas sp. NPDC058933]|uniref:DnaT-like ssDNA-binding protein n=1 Tax=Brevundimonas sp. NPDC058933 TaxID=3346673 RepID=UPI003BEED061